jgi:hypothetical protein
MSDEPVEPKSKTKSITEGTIAIALGGSVATFIVGVSESFGHFFPAKVESSFGTLLGILAYILFKGLRK